MGSNIEASADVSPFLHEVFVRFMELDLHGHVSNMWYLAYFDDAMLQYFMSHGVPRDAVVLQIVKSDIQWRNGGIRWGGGPVLISVKPIGRGTSSFTLEFEVLHGEHRLTVGLGRMVYVCVGNAGASLKCEIPEPLRRVLEIALKPAEAELAKWLPDLP